MPPLSWGPCEDAGSYREGVLHPKVSCAVGRASSERGCVGDEEAQEEQSREESEGKNYLHRGGGKVAAAAVAVTAATERSCRASVSLVLPFCSFSFLVRLSGHLVDCASIVGGLVNPTTSNLPKDAATRTIRVKIAFDLVCPMLTAAVIDVMRQGV